MALQEGWLPLSRRSQEARGKPHRETIYGSGDTCMWETRPFARVGVSRTTTSWYASTSTVTSSVKPRRISPRYFSLVLKLPQKLKKRFFLFPFIETATSQLFAYQSVTTRGRSKQSSMFS